MNCLKSKDTPAKQSGVYFFLLVKDYFLDDIIPFTWHHNFVSILILIDLQFCMFQDIDQRRADLPIVITLYLLESTPECCYHWELSSIDGLWQTRIVFFDELAISGESPVLGSQGNLLRPKVANGGIVPDLTSWLLIAAQYYG